MIAQFIFYWFPGYIMPVLSGLSWICIIKPDNYLLAQLTDYRGLSLGSFSLNWYSITFFLNSPLVVPRWALVNIGGGFALVAWVIIPIIYFQDVWETRSSDISTSTQSTSDWSAMGLVGSSISRCSRLVVFDCLCCRYDWYNVLFALSIPIIFVLPFGMVASITGQLIHNQGIYYVMVGIVGLLWSGDQPKMMTFIAVGYTTYCQTLYIVSNMKLGHYMKIPPRTLFLIQSLTCLVCSSFGVGIQYYFYATQRYFDQKDAFIYQSEFDLTNVDSAMVNNTFWLASRRYKWRHLVHIPLMLATVSWMPLVDAGTLLTWLLICLVGNDMFN
jgi:hypothetical protein